MCASASSAYGDFPYVTVRNVEANWRAEPTAKGGGPFMARELYGELYGQLYGNSQWRPRPRRSSVTPRELGNAFYTIV
eukprot:gene12466-biopygen8175